MKTNVKFHQELGKAAFLSNFKVEKGLSYGTLDISVRRYFTNVDGTIVNKATVPANLQVKYPYALFGKYDYEGGYKFLFQSNPTKGAAKYLYTFDVARSVQFLFSFSGFNNIRNELQPGDLVHLFTDDLDAPNYFIWVVISAPDKNYVGLLSNTGSGLYRVRNVKYLVDASQASQFSEQIVTAFINPLSEPRYDFISPQTYRNPFYQQSGGVPFAQSDMKIKMQLSPYLGLYTYLTFGNDEVNYQFDIEFKLLYISENGK